MDYFWKELSSSDGDIAIQPNFAYSVIASVKSNHSEVDIAKIVSARGLTITDYAEQGERVGLGPDPNSPNYRYVAVTAVASASGSLPWKAPWPLSIADSSHIVRAWMGTSASATVVPAPAKSSSGLVWVALAGSALAGAAWWYLHRR